MKAAELRQLSVEELEARLGDLAEEGFNLRFQHTLGQLSSPIRLRQVRRDAAQVRTVLREHELGLRTLASRSGDSAAGDE
jgi:large subunit ribosomal protein L29